AVEKKLGPVKANALGADSFRPLVDLGQIDIHAQDDLTAVERQRLRVANGDVVVVDLSKLRRGQTISFERFACRMEYDLAAVSIDDRSVTGIDAAEDLLDSGDGRKVQLTSENKSVRRPSAVF